MKSFIILLEIVAIIFLCQCKAEQIPNNRKWLEIDKMLYRVEPDGKYTWKQAVAECKKEHTNLIRPKGGYDYAKLKDAIKHNFDHYSSFWTTTTTKWTNVFHQIGLAKDQDKRQKCHKFDNSTAFKFLPDDCEQRMGFICEKPLLEKFSSFNSKTTVYFIQPQQQFTCDHAYSECEKLKMSLVVLTEHQRNKLLKDFVFINYGMSPSFWFGANNETHVNCATYRRGESLTNTSKLGFICQRNNVKHQTISMRHLVLIIFSASALICAIIGYLFVRCCCLKRKEEFYLSQSHYPEEVKVTDIK